MRLSLLIICLLMATAGCTREGLVEVIDLTNLPKRPALLAILMPGDSVQVAVLWPSGINEVLTGTATQISDATVRIENTKSQQTATLSLWRPGVYSVSQHSFPVEPGQSYRVTVNVPGQKLIAATCQVPQRAAAFSATVSGGIKKVAGDYYQRTVRLRWPDAGDQYEYLVGSQNATLGWEFRLASVPLRVIRADGWVLYDLQISHDKPTPFRAKVALMTLDRHTADLFQQLETTRNVSTADLSATLIGFRGVLPDISNVENGEGIVGACLRVDSTLTIN